MGIEYYAFALFVAGLICLIAVLVKFLFADLRRQKKLLDEKESSLLKLYTTVESIMEDFAEQSKVITDEIREFDNKVDNLDTTVIKAAGDALERAERINGGEGFRSVLDEIVGEAAPETQVAANNNQGKKNRNELILSLYKEGKTEAQIASELAITQNEVMLVVGIGV